MMRRIVVVAGLLSGSLIVGPSVHAATVTNPIRIANWSGGSYSKENSKQFDHCGASATSSGGNAISYSVNREYRWRLTFSNPAWNFTSGLSLNLLLAMGERDHIRGRAVAVEKQVLEVVVDDNISLFARLAMGGQMKVTAGGLAFEFQLADSDEVLTALAQCVMRSTGIAQNTKSKRPGAQRAAQPAPALDAAADEEARALAADLVGYAGITGARMSSLGEGSAEPRAAAVWKAGLVTGTVSVLGPNDVAKVEEMPDKLIDSEARKCPGGLFFLSELDAIDQSPVARVFTSCKAPEATTWSYYLAVPRPNGGLFLLSTMTKGSGFAGAVQRQAELVDAKVRATIMTSLRRLDQRGAAARP
jgi:hypothetical protein